MPLILSFGLVGCAHPMSLNDFQFQKARWHDCDQAFLNEDIQSNIFKESKVQCASLLVPADYSNLDTGKSFRIQMMRIQNAQPSKRIGTIFINPGGPGGSGIEQLQYSEFPKSLVASYDIIGFDPRGVNHSKFSDGTEIKCDDRLDLETYFNSEGSPANSKEYEANIKISDAFLNDCASRNPYWWTLSTANVVTDLELMRRVITGDKDLNFIGASYGTTIAGLYVSRYPNNVGKIVFDSPTDGDGYSSKSALEDLIALEQKLRMYLKSYAQHSNITFEEAWSRLWKAKQKADANKLLGFAGIKASPSSPEDRVSSESLLIHGIRALTYWPDNQAIKAFNSAMEELDSDNWNGAFEWYALSLDGYEPSSLNSESLESRNIVRSNSYEVMLIVNAMDYSPVGDADDDLKYFKELRTEVAPLWSKLNLDSNGFEYEGNDYGLSWEDIALQDPEIPDPPDSPTPRTNYSRKPLLIVGSRRDAVTPFYSAKDTARQLNSPLISVDSGTHSPAGGYDIPCLNEILVSYFLSDATIKSQSCRG